MNQTSTASNLQPPMSPYAVLLIAILLPGMGQAINNAPMRGLLMGFFMLLLGMLTYHIADPSVSLVGHFAGGLFVYAVSVMDAYYWAKYRSELFRKTLKSALA